MDQNTSTFAKEKAPWRANAKRALNVFAQCDLGLDFPTKRSICAPSVVLGLIIFCGKKQGLSGDMPRRAIGQIFNQRN